MVAPGFGWSAGDIIQSIRVIWTIIEAFDSAKGSKKEYTNSRVFLRAFVPVLERIKHYLEKPEEDAQKTEMETQAQIIEEAYASFEAHLDKRLGLSSRSVSTKFVAHTLLWALDDISKKVEKLKSKVLNAIAFLGPILAFEIRDKVDHIATEFKADVSNRDMAMQQVTQLLAEIHSQTEALSQFSQDYGSKIEQVEDQNHKDMAAIHDSMKLIKDSQADLADSLVFLSEQIEEQRQQSKSQAEADEWIKLQAEAQTQTTTLNDMQETTSRTLNAAATTIKGLSNLNSSNKALLHTSKKVGGLSKTFSGFGSLLQVGGIGAKKPAQSTSSKPQISRNSSSPGTITNSPSAYARRSQVPRESVPLKSFPPPPRRAPPHQRAKSFSSYCPSSMGKPTVPLIKATPPPLPPRSVSGPVTLAEGEVQDRPPLPLRSRQRPEVPRKPKTLSLALAQPAPDTNQPLSSVLTQHEGAISPVAPVSNRTPSTALRLVAVDTNQAQPSPPSASCTPPCAPPKFVSLIRPSRSLPKTPTLEEGSSSPFTGRVVETCQRA